jgi:hypothetical protein
VSAVIDYNNCQIDNIIIGDSIHRNYLGFETAINKNVLED